jgi:hypothetical protein
MSHLATDLRTLLEKTVVEARDVAERGAQAGLEALSTGEAKVPAHLSNEERDLRVRLRARARQLGDALDPKSQVQALEHLVREVAYEHWHRMLFARFLAESHLLVEPETGIALSLGECRDLAREQGEDPWALAGRYAERMLPAIFRSGDPALALALPPERLNRLEVLLERLPTEVFAADDALGWVYQFWQTKRKKEVNASGRKIGAEELSAVTQLFTEPYMVQFLLHNTLGAWHAGKILAARPDLPSAATSEEELRRACALPGYEWPYLRFVRDPAESGSWRPAAGTFPGWPSSAREVTFLDPCCGSGHFLVEGFSALVALRQAEEGLDLQGAVRAVLTDNLHGLELDPRCTQLAAFAVALAAWRRLGRVEPLPPFHIACSGLAVGVPKSEWVKLAGDDNPDLRHGMDRLHDFFRKAPTLGSLLDPRQEVGQDLFTASLERLEAHLIEAVGKAETLLDASAGEVAVTAAGMAVAVGLLLARYTLIATNVPFRTRGDFGPALLEFSDRHYRDAKKDLATVFLARLVRLVKLGGGLSVVTPHNWQFLSSYTNLRKELLRDESWAFSARLGPGAFETIGGEVVKVALTGLCRQAPTERSAFFAIDASAEETPAAKALALRGLWSSATDARFEGALNQAEQLEHPDARIVFGEGEKGELLSRVAHGVHGLGSKDSPRFFAQFWELPNKANKWELLQTTVERTTVWAGLQQVVFWEKGQGELAARGARGEAVLAGAMAWGRPGVAISQMGDLPACVYSQEIFDKNVAVISPKDPKHVAAVWAFCSSPEFSRAVRRIDQNLKVTNATLVKVPFDLAYWQSVARERYPNGLPEPWSDDPTQWIFHGHPARSAAPLQVAVARLLGYRWPAELDAQMRLAVGGREWVKRSEELLGLADRDGIACLSSLRSEEPAVARLRGFLASSFGEEWNAAKERELLAATPSQAPSLEEWLRDRFFEEHCGMFHQRPFIWHLWDGRKDGFHALVNYHRLADGAKGRQLLETLAYAYLGEWIDRQRRGVAAAETGADARLAAALELQGELRRILDGELPYDIFIRWKPLRRQPIGWEPDLDDGVRINARPFLTARLSGGRAGAGLFRAKPSIHWRKDRGTEPQRDQSEFPWFWNDGVFHGERHNDLHVTLEDKRRAREVPVGAGNQR